MRVRKLIEVLQQQKPQKQVIVTWEGIFKEINLDNIYLAPDGRIIIDADNNWYKKEILSGEYRVWSDKYSLKNKKG